MKSVTADKLPNMHSTEYQGIPIVIEWPKGSVRVGKHDDGESWKMDMKCDYGYIPSTVDADDDDHVDVYIGPNKDSEFAYVLEQMKDGHFDEYKIMLGFDSLEEAEKMYLEHMPEESLGEITEVPFDEFLATATKVMPEAAQHEEEIHEERAEKNKEATYPHDEGIALEPTFVDRPPAKFKRPPARTKWRWEEALERYGWSEQQENVWVNHGATLAMMLTVGRTNLPDKWGNWYDELGFQVLNSQKQIVAKGESSQEFLNTLNALSGEIVRTGSSVKTGEEKLTLIEAFVKLYKHEFQYFDKVADEVHDQLSEALNEAGIRAIVTYRAKKPRKLKGKLIERSKTRHYESFQDIYDDVVDMAGVRVALYLPNDREAVGQIIEQHFTLMRKPKVFPRDRGPKDGIGYIATHYLVRLKPESLHKDEYQYADTNVEIQVASVLMHAWAEVTHDLLYKPQAGSTSALTPEEIAMIDDLNRVVQEGEGVLEKLQQSVENRSHEDLRFELMAKLAHRLGVQSKGHATRRITAGDVRAAAKKAFEDLYASLMQSMKDLGWNYAENDNWSDPVKPQEQIQVFHDGWVHKAWDEIKGNGTTVQELQEYLGKRGLDDAKHPHKLPEQPPLPAHVSYLKAKLALWKAHSKL